MKKTEPLDNLETDSEMEYEDWQYEMSTSLAVEFIDEQIIPVLDGFDYENADGDYIPGVATYVLFTRIVESLVEQGFTDEEMKRVIAEVGELSNSRVMH